MKNKQAMFCGLIEPLHCDGLSHLAQVIALLKVLRFNGVSHLLIGHSKRLDRFFKVLPELKEENKAQ